MQPLRNCQCPECLWVEMEAAKQPFRKPLDALVTGLKDGFETHVGYLMQCLGQSLRDQANVHVVESCYTARGVEARVYLPLDKKYYRITIEEALDRR